MALGENVNLKDRIIRKTVKGSNTGKASNTNITNKIGMPSPDPKTDTYKTKKMTFYVKEELLEKLYNFSYWDRRSLTDAFNVVLDDGLKGKNIKPRK